MRIVKKDAMQVFAEFVSTSKIEAQLIPWLVEEKSIGIEVLMPDSKIVYGSVEAELLKTMLGAYCGLRGLAMQGLTAKAREL